MQGSAQGVEKCPHTIFNIAQPEEQFVGNAKNKVIIKPCVDLDTQKEYNKLLMVPASF